MRLGKGLYFYSFYQYLLVQNISVCVELLMLVVSLLLIMIKKFLMLPV